MTVWLHVQADSQIKTYKYIVARNANTFNTMSSELNVHTMGHWENNHNLSLNTFAERLMSDF